jgi:hypothetical protein
MRCVDRVSLEQLLGQGLTLAEIGRRFDLHEATVGYWSAWKGLHTCGEGRGQGHRDAEVRRHGMTQFWLEGRGYYRCKRCRMERVSQRRRKMKLILVAEAGGRCALCGYDHYVGALHFHHLDPSTKRFHLSMQGVTRSLAAARAEMAKCVLLCANCHAEVEAGLASLPGADTAQSKVA